MKFSNEMYDKLKPYAMWILSLTALLIDSADTMFNFPHGDIVLKVVIGVNFILGLVLQDSTKKYKAALEEQSKEVENVE